jgi:MFS family permease
LGGCAALAIGLGVGRFLLTPMLPVMRAHGLGFVEAGWLAAATNLGYLAGALACIWLTARSSTLLRVGMVATALLTAAMAVPSGNAVALTLRALTGFASAAVMVHSAVILTPRLLHLGARRLEGVFYSGPGVGVMVSGALVPTLAQLGASPAALWLGFGLASTLGLALIWRVFAGSEHRERAHMARGRLPAGAIGLIGAYGSVGFGYAIPATFLPLIARQTLHSALLADRLWPLYGVAVVAVTLVLPLVPLAAHRNRLALAGCHASMIAGLLCCLWLHSPMGVALAAILNGGVLMPVVMYTMREAHRIAPTSSTVLTALLTAAFGAGQILGPLLAGYTAALTATFDGALVTAAVVLAAGGALVLLHYEHTAGAGPEPSTSAPQTGASTVPEAL